MRCGEPFDSQPANGLRPGFAQAGREETLKLAPTAESVVDRKTGGSGEELRYGGLRITIPARRVEI